MTSAPSPSPPLPTVGGRLRALGALLTVPNLGLNLFFAVGFLAVAMKGSPDWTVAFLVLVAFVAARNAGHAFNQVVDRELDAKNPRTQGRPLVTGALSVGTAKAVIVLNVLVFLVAAGLIRWWLPVLALPALAFILGYSYTKRATSATTVLLGAVQALIPAGVYLAVDGSLPLPSWTAIVALLLFGTAFESVHSLGDLDSDREQGLFSLPLALGRERVPYLVGGLLASAVALLALYTFWSLGPSIWELVMIVGMGACAAYEVAGLRGEQTPLLRLFRLHFVMGAVFLISTIFFYI